MRSMNMNIHGVNRVTALYQEYSTSKFLTFNFDGAEITVFFEHTVDESRVKALQDALAGIYEDQAKELAA